MRCLRVRRRIPFTGFVAKFLGLPSFSVKFLMDVMQVFVGHMGINLGGSNICVPEKCLHRTKVSPVTEEVRREAMTDYVRRYLAGNACNRCISLQNSLDTS